MAMSDVVAQGITDLNAAQASANSSFLTAFYGKVVADQPATTTVAGTFTQADIDAAVAKVTSADQGAMSDLQNKLSLDDAQVTKLKAGLSQLATEIAAALGS